MKLPMMNEGIGEGTVRPFHLLRDEFTEVERLPAAVRPGVTRADSQQGQTRVTFVENESTDDE
jgi:hypothetical protein